VAASANFLAFARKSPPCHDARQCLGRRFLISWTYGPQGHRFLPARLFELVGDLVAGSDDHLIVTGHARVLVNRFRHRRGSVGRLIGRAGGKRRAGQADPQLRAARGRLAAGARRAAAVAIVHQLEALIGERVQHHVRPGPQLLGRAQPQRLPGALGSRASIWSTLVTLLRRRHG